MTPAPPDSFGGRVRARRREVGLTQKFVGGTLGRSQVWVSHVESERHSPSIGDLVLLTTLLATTADWLLLGKEPRDAA